MTASCVLPVALECHADVEARVRYVLETMLLAIGITPRYVTRPPLDGPWLLYAQADDLAPHDSNLRCVALLHQPVAWLWFDRMHDANRSWVVDGLHAVLPEDHVQVTQAACGPAAPGGLSSLDLPANAFYFLSSWSETVRPLEPGNRRMHCDSTFARLGVPQDIVDRYLARLRIALEGAFAAAGRRRLPQPSWPGQAEYAVVLSHDIDFIPRGLGDIAMQGAKTLVRHLMRQRDAGDAARAMAGLAVAGWQRRNPYCGLRQMIEREQRLGVRASYQVATARRHPADVNYRIADDRVRNELRVIVDAGFDLCLHGSYRSTETDHWYGEEVQLLTRRLARPRGSRQHFLSFDAQRLFTLQEASGIEYDMSMGYPDHPGPRSGFSFPYFPWSFAHRRPFRVLQIGLTLMDVTLQSYLRLKPAAAWQRIEATLEDLRVKRGAMSVVWHPIVFGGARDPGYDKLFWQLAERVKATRGLATDGREINAHWRQQAAGCTSLGPAAKSMPQQAMAA